MRTAIYFLFVASTIVFGAEGSGSHGGDKIKLTFSKARLKAVEQVLKFDARFLPKTWDPKVVAWLIKNSETLAEDIALSQRVWTEEDTIQCAHTDTVSKANILLSVPKCQSTLSSIDDASQILIHESSHHLGVEDEAFADLVAISVYWVWEHSGAKKEISNRWISIAENEGIRKRFFGDDRTGLSVAHVGNKILVLGKRINEMGMSVYDLSLDTWNDVKPSERLLVPLMARGRVAMTAIDSSRVAITSMGGPVLYDVEKNTWESFPDTKDRDKECNYNDGDLNCEIAYLEDLHLLFSSGPMDGSGMTLALYDTQSMQRVNVPRPPIVAGGDLNISKVVSLGNKVLVFGVPKGEKASSTFIFDPKENKWEVVTSDPMGLRYSPSVVWTGKEVIFWGGLMFAPNHELSAVFTGSAYNPKTQSWRTISTVNAPTARVEPHALWNGKYMILWGGCYQGQEKYGDRFKSGALYDPQTDSWTSTGEDQAPEDNEGASATWTGEGLFIIKAGKFGAIFFP